MPRLQILQHKSYHPYLEKNKQRVRQDEAKAREEELAREQLRVDKDSEARLLELRRRAGSPSAAQEGEAEADPGDLPSTSSSSQLQAGPSKIIEKHRRDKAREEKRAKKQRDRLDFDFPSETARRTQGKEKGKEVDRSRDRGYLARGVAEEETEQQGERSGLNGNGDAGVGGAGVEDHADKSWTSNGHINFFAEFENGEAPPPKRAPTLAELAKQKAEKELDKHTLYLGRPDRETKPWYADKELKRVEDKEVGEEAEIRRARDRRKDIRSKERHDPLTQINSLLSTSTASSSHSRSHNSHPPSRHRTGDSNGDASGGAGGGGRKTPDLQAARLAREKSERERALALIAKSKATPRRIWDDTPSTVAGGGSGRTWGEELEREKDRAGNRFFGGGGGGGGGGGAWRAGWDGRSRTGRSWEV